MADVRAYLVHTRGFGPVVVRARSNRRARMLCAQGFAGAGWGTVGEGLRDIVSCRLSPAHADVPLVTKPLGPEGICMRLDLWEGTQRNLALAAQRGAIGQLDKENSNAG